MAIDSDSNARKLLAILYGLKSFKSRISGKTVKIFTDNRNASIIIARGSNSLRLHLLALKVFKFCSLHNISLEIEWIHRSLNEYAGSVSRIVDYDNWALCSTFFLHISPLFGPFHVDRFASKLWNPGCEGVDGFSVSWGGLNNLLVPPKNLVAHVPLVMWTHGDFWLFPSGNQHAIGLFFSIWCS